MIPGVPNLLIHILRCLLTVTRASITIGITDITLLQFQIALPLLSPDTCWIFSFSFSATRVSKEGKLHRQWSTAFISFRELQYQVYCGLDGDLSEFWNPTVSSLGKRNFPSLPPENGHTRPGFVHCRLNVLERFQWRTWATLSCLQFLYRFWANFLHSAVIWLSVSSLSFPVSLLEKEKQRKLPFKFMYAFCLSCLSATFALQDGSFVPREWLAAKGLFVFFVFYLSF